MSEILKTFDQERRERLADILEEINRWVESGQPPMKEIDAVVNDMGGSLVLLYDLFKDWSEFSGEMSFPIPCPDGGCPRAAFYRIPFEEFYDASEPYGASRMRFIERAIGMLSVSP